MKINHILGHSLIALTLASCGNETERNTTQERPSETEAASEADGQTPFATGNVVAISDDSVTIAHGPVPEIGWPEMMMAFTATSPDQIDGLTVGDSVSFSFREAEAGYALVSIEKAAR